MLLAPRDPWRAVDDEAEVLEVTTRPYRDVWIATKFLANLVVRAGTST